MAVSLVVLKAGMEAKVKASSGRREGGRKGGFGSETGGNGVTDLVQFILALLRVVHGGLVAIVPKVPGSYESVSTCMLRSVRCWR